MRGAQFPGQPVVLRPQFPDLVLEGLLLLLELVGHLLGLRLDDLLLKIVRLREESEKGSRAKGGQSMLWVVKESAY